MGLWKNAHFCVQRIRRATRLADRDSVELEDGDRALNPACVNSCATNGLIFGDWNDPDSQINQIKNKEMQEGGRAFGLLENLGTSPNVIYLKQVDESAEGIMATRTFDKYLDNLLSKQIIL